MFPSRSQTFKEPDDEPDTILSSVDENVILVIGDVWPVRLYFSKEKAELKLGFPRQTKKKSQVYQNACWFIQGP